MRPASILLALVAVLGFASCTSAADYRIWVRDRGYGIYDWEIYDWEINMGGKIWGGGTAVDLGPLGHYDVPFTATQGLVGLCVIVVALLVLLVALAARWKRKQAA